MINHLTVVHQANISGRYVDVIDAPRLDAQLSSITTHVNMNTGSVDKLRVDFCEHEERIQEINKFMEFYFQTMPGMKDAFNAWQIAQKTKERILDGHSND